MKVPAIGPIMTELLPSQRPEVRGTACTMLGVIIDQSLAPPIAAAEATKTVQPLLDRLVTDEAWSVRRKAASALGMLGKLGRADATIVNALIGHLDVAAETQPEVRAASAEALGKLVATQAAPALVHALMTGRQGATIEIATALQRLGPPAVPSIVAALSSSDAEVRRVATNTIAEIGTKVAAVPLASQLKDPDPVIRRIAAKALVDTAVLAPQVVPQLVAALMDSDWQVYHSVEQALGNVGAPAAVALVQMLGPDNPRVNRMASLALQKIGQVSISPLAAALQSPNAHARQWAAITLGAIGGDAVEQAGKVLLNVTVPVASRIAAAAALGYTGAKFAVQPLAQAAKDPQPDLRVAILRALAQVGADEGTTTLVNGLTDPSVAVRETAMELLKRWARADVATQLKQVASGGDADAKLRATIALAYQGSPDALGPVGDILGSNVQADAGLADLRGVVETAAQDATLQPALRQEAILSIGYIGQEQSLSVLQPFLTDDSPYLVTGARSVALIGKAAYQRLQQEQLKAGGRPVTAATNKSEAASMLLDLFLKTGNEQTRLEAAGALSMMGDQAAYPLIASFGSAPDTLKPWIAAALGAVGKPAAEALSTARGDALKVNNADTVAWVTASMELVGDAQHMFMIKHLPENQQPDRTKVDESRKILDRIREAQP
jgi:HEAT repeat protein